MKPILHGPIPRYVWLLLIAVLPACHTGVARSLAPKCGIAAPTPAHDAFLATLWQQNAAEYDALGLQVYARAETLLPRAIADPSWNALVDEESQPLPANAPLAVIADIDETVLDNSAFAAREIRNVDDDCMTSAQSAAAWRQRWTQWLEDARAPAVSGAAQFMQFAVAQGVDVYYVSNRKDDEKLASCRNLINVGLPVHDCALQVLTRNDADNRGKDKVSRRRQIANSHRVVMLFGDNLGDFSGNVLTGNRERDAIVAQHRDAWGERWFMLPNSGYGSWEEVLGRRDPEPDEAATASAQRARNRAAKERLLDECRASECPTP